MTKVAFFLNNKNIQSADCSNVTEGNPGIGGSEYLIILISFMLSQRENDLHVLLYIVEDQKLPLNLCIKKVSSIDEAILDADKNGFDFFIINKKDNDWFEKPYDNLQSKMRFIFWCHNSVSRHEIKFWNKHPSLGKILYVGREQMDLYRDLAGFENSDYVYNCVPLKKSLIKTVEENPYCKRNHIVTYVGSLVPVKSFHILAQIWPNIKRRVPDAQLYVIGSGSLYNRSQKMGPFGIAEASYEHQFINYLLANDGKSIDDSVHFLGNLGKEKNEILLKTRVGVPNPLGTSETFCLSAVEMQSMGCQVVALKAPGYYDTFINGCVVSNVKQLENHIVEMLLSDMTKNYSEVYEYFDKNFSMESVANDWEKLLTKKGVSNHIHSIYPLKNPIYRMKWLKEFLRLLKNVIPYLNILPPLETFFNVKKIISKRFV